MFTLITFPLHETQPLYESDILLSTKKKFFFHQSPYVITLFSADELMDAEITKDSFKMIQYSCFKYCGR